MPGVVNTWLGAIFDNQAWFSQDEINRERGVVQEYHPPRGSSIVRVEVLGGRFLYAIRIHNDPSQGFNLCPADICQVEEPTITSTAAAGAEGTFGPVSMPAASVAKKPLKIKADDPPA